jgi:enoyl-CoA hydratase/carnithine racemase
MEATDDRGSSSIIVTTPQNRMPTTRTNAKQSGDDGRWNKNEKEHRLLFNKDGISLTATILSFHDDADDDDGIGDDNGATTDQGIILTISLHRHDEKNVINPHMISLLRQSLDIIDSHPLVVNTCNKALIITGLSLPSSSSSSSRDGTNNNDGGGSKFFSNGLDLQWILHAANDNSNSNSDSINGNSNHISKMIESFNSQILARILTMPFRTIAAINGHCIGAGLFLALACDYRIMRTERGYLQWPEARLGMRLTKGFMELSKAKIRSDGVLREGILTAKKYSPIEALASGIIDATCPIEELYDHAFQLAEAGLPSSPLGMNLEYFDHKSYTDIKIEMYTDAYRALKFGEVDDLPHSRI